jgi:hypothetical protein
MSELNAKARALVDATQFSDEPTATDCDRIHDAIAARIAVGVSAGALVLGAEIAKSAVVAPVANGAPIGAAAAASLAPIAGSAVIVVAAVPAPAVALGGTATLGVASTSVITGKLAAWVVALGLTAGAVGVTAHHAMSDRAPESRAAVQTPSANEGPKNEPGRRAPPGIGLPTASDDRASADKESEPTSTAPLPLKAAGAVRGTTAQALASTAAPPAPGEVRAEEPRAPVLAPGLDAELALMRRARAALVEGRAEDALAALDEHSRRFPGGALAEERAMQRVAALCLLGRADAAREEGQRFVADHPRSSYVTSIRSSCAFANAKNPQSGISK